MEGDKTPVLGEPLNTTIARSLEPSAWIVNSKTFFFAGGMHNVNLQQGEHGENTTTFKQLQ